MVAAVAVAVVAVVDLVSAVTPNVSWRGHLLVHVEPFAVMRTAHALAVPVSVALLVTAYYLYRRRSRAFRSRDTAYLFNGETARRFRSRAASDISDSGEQEAVETLLPCVQFTESGLTAALGVSRESRTC